MAELGPTTIYGDMIINGSVGGAFRVAYCKTAAPSATTITCYLDTDSTGEEVTVQCLTPGGTSTLDNVVPRLGDGDAMIVVKISDTWYSTTIFEDSEDISGTTGLPKLIYIDDIIIGADAIKNISDSNTWATDKAIIKAIKVTTLSTDWDLTLYCDSSGSGGMFDRMEVVTSASGSQVVLLDLPYIDNNSTNSVHLRITDSDNPSDSSTVEIYGIEAV